MTQTICNNNNVHIQIQSPFNIYGKGDKAGSWSFKGVLRAVLWGCTSSSFKARFPKWMPSSFSQRRSDIRIPESIKRRIDALREPDVKAMSKFEKIKYKFDKFNYGVQSSSAYIGYCNPLLGLSIFQSKIELAHENLLADVGRGYDIEYEEGINGNYARQFIWDFVISRAQARGEAEGPYIGLLKNFLRGRLGKQGADPKVEDDLNKARHIIRKAMLTAKHEIKKELEDSGVLDRRESISPLEYSKFVKENRSYASEFHLRLKLHRKFRQYLQQDLEFVFGTFGTHEFNLMRKEIRPFSYDEGSVPPGLLAMARDPEVKKSPCLTDRGPLRG